MADQSLECSSDEDALRLVLAFYCIMEPDKRDEVMALAQRYARLTSDMSLSPGRTVSAADQ